MPDAGTGLHGHALNAHLVRVTLAEALGTLVLVLAITAAVSAATLADPISGGGVNPARAIGPMIAAGRFTDWWVYLIGPLVGGVLAATLYIQFMREETAS
jgi:aquaporin Z/aquaporin NIP